MDRSGGGDGFGGGNTGSGGEEFPGFAQGAFASRFSATPCLKTLWERAALGSPDTPEGFVSARREFWRLVNSSGSADAESVRAIIVTAGYELQSGTNAPLLKLQNWDHRTSRELSDRRLTIDHADPQSATRKQTLSSSNLRFMSQRDNSLRGDRYGADDMLVRRADDPSRLLSR